MRESIKRIIETIIKQLTMGDVISCLAITGTGMIILVIIIVVLGGS